MAVKRKASRTPPPRRSSRIAGMERPSTATSAEPEFVDLDSPPRSQAPPQSPPHSPPVPDWSESDEGGSDADSDGRSGSDSDSDSDSDSGGGSHAREQHLIHFRSVEDKNCFEETFTKSIVKGRSFKWEYLEQIKFPYLDKLKAWRWKEFLTLDRPVYRNISKYFYFNGRLEKHDIENNIIKGTKEEDGFHTYLQGRHLRVRHDELWKAIGKPRHNPGAPRYYPKKYDPLKGAKMIWGDDNLKHVPTGMEGISVHNRILHLMICRAINPRQGSHGKMTSEDIWWMEQILLDNPPNLAAIVMKKLKQSIRLLNSNRGLYYGRVVCQIIDRFKIEGLKDKEMDNKKPLPFSEKTIKMTGFVQDEVTGEWRQTRGKAAGKAAGEASGKDAKKTAEDVAMEMAVMSVPDDDDTEHVNDQSNNGGEEFGGEGNHEEGPRFVGGEEFQDHQGWKQRTQAEREDAAHPAPCEGFSGGADAAYDDVRMNDANGDVGGGNAGGTDRDVNVVAELEGLKEEVKGLRAEVSRGFESLKRENNEMAATIMDALRAIGGRGRTPIVERGNRFSQGLDQPD